MAQHFKILVVAALLLLLAVRPQQSAMHAFSITVTSRPFPNHRLVSVVGLHKPTTTLTTRTSFFSLYGFFGGMFGGNDPKSKAKDAILGTYDINVDDKNVQFESLADYIQNKWAQLLVTGNIKLTTPVQIQQVVLDNENADDGVEAETSVRLLFQKVDTGYKSKKDEESEINEDEDSDSSSKKEEPKQGGVEISVQKLANGLRIQARRCEIDDDTMIKEMSEETIVRELEMAIDVWKKNTL